MKENSFLFYLLSYLTIIGSVPFFNSTAAIADPVSYTGQSSSAHETLKSGSNEIKPDRKIDPAESVLSLTLQSSIIMALDNNANFQINRLSPAIKAYSEEMERASFDPTVAASISGQREKVESGRENLVFGPSSDADSATAGLRLTEYLPTGTTIEAGAEGSITALDDESDGKYRNNNYDVTITQALLRNRGMDANLVGLRTARIDTKISIHELQGAAESLISQVEEVYWDYILAERSIAIYEKSLKIANRQVEEVKERIHVGKTAETELASAEAEAAVRHEQLIDAYGILEVKRLNLIRLISPSHGETRWNSRLNLLDSPELGFIKLDSVEGYVRVALQKRADIKQARLQLEQGNLEVISTRNGLLPKLDLFVRLGGSRYANSFSDKGDEDSDDISYSAGLQFEIPIGNRNAKARHHQQMLSAEQTKLALRNMEQLIQIDVRSAYVDVNRSGERIKAATKTRELREKILAIEVEKFRLGRSTTFLVAQAQRDMISSQIGEIEAVIDYRKALLNLHRLEGTLLERRQIQL